MPIYLSVDSRQNGANDARQAVKQFIDQINKHHYKIDARQESCIQNLINKYNDGIISRKTLEKSLGYAMDDIMKENNGERHKA